ncbi:M23 family metallopeptidase [Sphingomonas oryzagri]|uniref:M23 family metallopeptidase n=1 Tax=Sphingomonas oryzagri TaxID=3042314 RepID=A0ABT6MWQ6_9SPHN|nr:M23 family metallopeptidase [Sphingomonas oryzagri]MDH7637317.1 M23 family metallopeptidase [Sphingomonas oryzagri]
MKPLFKGDFAILAAGALAATAVPSPIRANGVLIITMHPTTAHARQQTIPRASAMVPAVITTGPAASIVGNPISFSRTIVSDAPISASRSDIRRLGTIRSGLPLSGILTSGFGMRDHPILGIRREHDGIDLAAPWGTPISATLDGTVTRAAWNGGYGLMVAMDDGQGTEIRFGHMSRLNVAVGQHIQKGQVIGYVGSSGLSTGPHVHYEMRVDGRPVNPMRSQHM